MTSRCLERALRWDAKLAGQRDRNAALSSYQTINSFTRVASAATESERCGTF